MFLQAPGSHRQRVLRHAVDEQRHSHQPIVANNTVGAGGSGADVAGAVFSQGHNFVGQTNGSSRWIVSDLTGTSAKPLDPGLSPLATHGVPTQK
ncbi:MAG TPA: hypothetical protein VH370_18700 [Humisphaera sp.]|nr:hypothetical protein [Humisphaera sp.]